MKEKKGKGAKRVDYAVNHMVDEDIFYKSKNNPYKEYIGKKFGDVITSLPKDMDIYLGSATAFFIVDKADELYKEVTTFNEGLSEIYEQINNFRREIHNLKRKYVRHTAIKDDLSKKYTEWKITNTDPEKFKKDVKEKLGYLKLESLKSTYNREKEIQKEKLDKEVEKCASINRMLQSSESKLNRLNEAYLHKKNRVEIFSTLYDRIIKDCYPKMNPKEGIIIVVEGDETGRFWTKDEYMKYKKSHYNV